MRDATCRLGEVVTSHPALAGRFRPGASLDKIGVLEVAVGPLSSAHKALYAWADGSVYDRASFRWSSLFRHPPLEQRLLPIDDVIGAKRMWDGFANEFASSPEIGQKNWPFGFWHPTWVPLFETDWSMTAWAPEACFDGPAGQVVRFDFKGGTHWWIESASLDAWVETLAGLLIRDHQLSLAVEVEENDKVTLFRAFERELRCRLNPDLGSVPLLPDPHGADRFQRSREKI